MNQRDEIVRARMFMSNAAWAIADEEGRPTVLQGGADGRLNAESAASILGSGLRRVPHLEPDTYGFADEDGQEILALSFNADGTPTDRMIGYIAARMEARQVPVKTPRALPGAVKDRLKNRLGWIGAAIFDELNKWYGEVPNGNAADLIKAFRDSNVSWSATPTFAASRTKTSEATFRRPAWNAYALALHVESEPSSPVIEARARQAWRIARSLVFAHRANNNAPVPETQADASRIGMRGEWLTWGGDPEADFYTNMDGSWQSALWAAGAARAIWLLKGRGLPDEDNTLEAAKLMMAWEANRFNTVPAQAMFSPGRGIMFVGNTYSEEMGWNALAISVAIQMNGNHENAPTWRRKLVEYALTSTARREDYDLCKVVNQRRMASLVGWNVRDDGLIVNHEAIHPNYIVAPFQQIGAAIAILARERIAVPDALAWNLDVIYRALSMVEIKAGDGGYNRDTKVYQADGSIAYAGGNSWAALADDVCADVVAHCLTLDSGIDVPALDWAQKHLDAGWNQFAGINPEHPENPNSASALHWNGLNLGFAYELALYTDRIQFTSQGF